MRKPVWLAAFFTLCLTALASAPSHAQDSNGRKFGLQLQLYPAGIIFTGSYNYALDARSTLGIHLGGNFTDRDDNGDHLNEDGEGFGAGISYRRGLRDAEEGWFIGGRVDTWFLEIDWEDPRGGVLVTGTTDVVVVQPTVFLGYQWSNGFDITVSGGAEINVDTDGEDVGEGAIGLIGIRYRF